MAIGRARRGRSLASRAVETASARGGVRLRSRHRAGARAAPDRALLSRGRSREPPKGRHGLRAGARQAHPQPPPRCARHRKRVRSRLDLDDSAGLGRCRRERILITSEALSQKLQSNRDRSVTQRRYIQLQRPPPVHRAQQPVLERGPQRAPGEPAGGDLPVRALALQGLAAAGLGGSALITLAVLGLSITARAFASAKVPK